MKYKKADKVRFIGEDKLEHIGLVFQINEKEKKLLVLVEQYNDQDGKHFLGHTVAVDDIKERIDAE